MPADPQPSCEDVLYAFAVEPNPGRATLEQYLQDYPQYATELIDLSHELTRDVYDDETPLSDKDLALINRAWQRHADTAPMEILDPLSALSVSEQRNLAQRLDVPRQVITAFRERRVELTSVPPLFLEQLATAMNITIEMLRKVLTLPPELGLMRSYKAGERPGAPTSVTFEQLLLEANIPPEKRALLMKEES